jgi:hypothetical protein
LGGSPVKSMEITGGINALGWKSVRKFRGS